MSPRADLLVTETFDAGLFGEHVLETLDHAHKELLAEKARVVPKGKVGVQDDCLYLSFKLLDTHSTYFSLLTS
jgi:hypothetical protein